MTQSKLGPSEKKEKEPSLSTASAPRINIFPDTNFFLQCKSIEELDWNLVTDCKEFIVIITRPIQREIDRLKNAGNKRQSRRARKAVSLFKNLLNESENLKTISANKSAEIAMQLRPELTYSETQISGLGTLEIDDQLVGIVHKFSLDHPNEKCMLLTHDSGVLASAKMVGVIAKDIPDAWLLPPESSEQDSIIKTLKDELKKAKIAEPAISIQALSVDNEELQSLEGSIKYYVQLNQSAIDGHRQRISTATPLETQFDERDSFIKSTRLAVGLHYHPPSKSEIDEYQKKYSQWINDCSELLENLHICLEARNSKPSITLNITNHGTRPADHVHIKIEAHGNFKIQLFPTPGEAAKRLKLLESFLSIPSSPTIPEGTFKHPLQFDHFAHRDLHAALYQDQNPMNDLARKLKSVEPKDLYKFHFIPKRPKKAVKEINLECELFRHGIDPFNIQLNVVGSDADNDIQGAISCHIYAGNMANKINWKLPVRIATKSLNCTDEAEALVSKFCSRSRAN